MRHYEIVFMVSPEQQDDQVSALIDRCTNSIQSAGGSIHRLENWGRRALAYPINKLDKAHYILMNIETEQSVIDELETTFRYNDAVIRSLFMRTKAAVTEPSIVATTPKETRDSTRPSATREAPKRFDNAASETTEAATASDTSANSEENSVAVAPTSAATAESSEDNVSTTTE